MQNVPYDYSKVKVSEPVEVAVIVVVLNPPAEAVDAVTPAEKVIEKLSGYFNKITPDPPAPPGLGTGSVPPPPPPVLAAPGFAPVPPVTPDPPPSVAVPAEIP
jgi:hypothetical protein